MTPFNGPEWQVFLAAERTLLAWVRTGIAVIGLGFVVARFGLVVRLLAPGEHPHLGPSTALGVGLVLLGSVATATASVQFVRFCGALPPTARPPRYPARFAPAAGFMLAAVGAVLGVYLVLTG